MRKKNIVRMLFSRLVVNAVRSLRIVFDLIVVGQHKKKLNGVEIRTTITNVLNHFWRIVLFDRSQLKWHNCQYFSIISKNRPIESVQPVCKVVRFLSATVHRASIVSVIFLSKMHERTALMIDYESPSIIGSFCFHFYLIRVFNGWSNLQFMSN